MDCLEDDSRIFAVSFPQVRVTTPGYQKKGGLSMKVKWIRSTCTTLAALTLCLTGCGQIPMESTGPEEDSTIEFSQEQEYGVSCFDDANLQGDVVAFSDTGFTLAPAIAGTSDDKGKELVQAVPGAENADQNVEITYGSGVQFQIVTLSMRSYRELSRVDADRREIKKQSSVCVYGSCQNTRHWTADKVLILRWQ